MYKIEEINRKFDETTNSGERYFLLAHTITEVILQNKREDSSEEEYLEGLIFSSFFIYKTVSSREKNKKEEILKSMILGLWEYSMEIDVVDNDILKFFIERYKTIESEILKMNENPNYMTPFIINNLYVNPLNKENLTTDKIMEKLDSEEFLKYSMLFRINYKHFLISLKNTFQLLQKQ